MRLSWVAIAATACLCAGGDRRDWSGLARLKPDDVVRVVQRTGSPVEAPMGTVTADAITVGGTTIRRNQVVRVERPRHGWSRGRKAALGAAIGFGAGFGAGYGGTTPCTGGWPLFCGSRTQAGFVVGAGGALVGAAVGALLPSHRTDVLYSIDD